MKISLYRTDRGERLGNTATVDDLVTKIEIEGDSYKITSLKEVWSDEEMTYLVPTKKYEIEISIF